MATQFRDPTSDESVNGTWSGTAGSRYTLVNDHPDSGATTSLTHGTLAGDICFGFSAFTIPSGSTINSITLEYYDYKTGFAAADFGGRLKVGGSYYNASSHDPAFLNITLRQDTWTTNPANGLAWSVDQINGSGTNNLQAFGMSSSDANPTVVLGSIRAIVDYTAPSGGGGGGGSGVYNFMWGVI